MPQRPLRVTAAFVFAVIGALAVPGFARAAEEATNRARTPRYSIAFADTALGETPAGWRDLIDYRPTRNWAVDGRGALRVMLKEYVGNPISGDRLRRREYLEKYGLKYFAGLLVLDGAAGDSSDPTVSAVVQKTPDENVFAGAVLRLRDRDNYYAARLRAADVLEIVKIADHKETRLVSIAARRHCSEAEAWTIEFTAQTDRLTARLLDEEGSALAQVKTRDGAFAKGAVGVTATTFAGIRSFSVRSSHASPTKLVDTKQEPLPYPIVRAVAQPEQLKTPFDRIAERYDVIVAGAGTGGFGAALQAARLGASVLLLEETDLIGGQLANAGVTSMDDGGIWAKNPVRERGIYREFHESAVNHYYTLGKDPFTAYHFNLQSEGGYEPHVARAILYGLIEETRARTLPGGQRAVLDLAIRTKVASVSKQSHTITGATLEEWTEHGPQRREVKSHVVIDATEYGDVIPLTGARYRIGTCRSDAIAPATPLQQHTWPGVIREYPQGVPDHLRIKEPPPGYAEVAKRFKNYTLDGAAVWGGEHRDKKGPRAWWTYVAWRGMPDSASPVTGERTEQRHTRCGLNGGNDYSVTAATAEDFAQRRKDEADGIHRTLGIIYWFQHDLGLPWAPPEDEGYFSPYQLAQMKARGVRDDLLLIAARLPQCPYVREARRIIGVQTLRGEDLYTRDRGDETARQWAGTVAINDYSFDLHGTRDELEKDLDEPDYINATGPFPVPFGVFIPEEVDGFLPAEKNISQSRLVNGATRLQPSTMLNGQAAGAIAALAARERIQPRQVNIIAVQSALLAAGDTLMSRWYSDIAWGRPLWQATQLLSLYGMMDRSGSMPKVGALGEHSAWGADEPLAPVELAATAQRLAKLVGDRAAVPSASELAARPLTRGEFAILAADLLRKFGSYRVGDPSLDDSSAHLADVKRLKKKQQKAQPAQTPSDTQPP